MSDKKTSEKNRRRFQLIVALTAALIPVVITFAIQLFEKKVKQLSLYYSESEKILTTKTALENEIRLFYDSLRVQNISSIKLTIINSGNEYISKDDFVDGPIQFIIYSGQKLDREKSPLIIDVIETENAKQRNSELIYSNQPLSTVDYLPSLLNPGDQIQLEVFITRSEYSRIDFMGKLKEGTINGLKPYESLLKQSKLEKFISSIHDFLGAKWVSIIVFVLFLAASALGNLSFLVAVQDDDENIPTGAIIIALAMFIQVLVTLGMLILVTIY